MRIAEIRRHEDLDAVLVSTLARGWSERYGGPIVVRRDASGQGQPWRVQPLLSAYFTDGVGGAARRFLRDSFRHTPRLLRMPLQWLLTDLLGSRPGLRIFSRPAFEVTPALPEAGHLLVVPGNARIRVFDFASGTVRALRKTGHDPSPMIREIEVRGPNRRGPFVPIRSFDSGGEWFEEEIVDALPLPRCPPWWPKRGFESKAFELLGRWAESGRTERTIRDYTEEVAGSLRSHASDLVRRFPDSEVGRIESWIPALVAAARPLERVILSPSHGDFQPGNILVTRSGHQVLLIDWEYSADRSADYDRLVYGLSTRSPRGLAGRLRGFLEGGGARLPSPIPGGPDSRRPLLALFLLEDLDWSIRSNLGGPRTAPSSGLLETLGELSTFGPNLEILFPP